MTGKSMRNVLLVVLVGVVGMSMSAGAGTIQLGNSGWSASWASFRDDNLALNVDFESSDTVFIEKFVQFTPSDFNESGGFIDPVVIVFQQTSSNAKPFIVINDEQVINNSGVPWVGFIMTILGAPGVQFDAGKTDVNPPGSGFTIDPFTTHTFSNGNTRFEVGGGTIPSGPPIPGPGDSNVWFPGTESGGLAIQTSATENGLRGFSLKEQPNIIPLPAAAWTGLSGLLGLAVMSAAKRIRKAVS